MTARTRRLSEKKTQFTLTLAIFSAALLMTVIPSSLSFIGNAYASEQKDKYEDPGNSTSTTDDHSGSDGNNTSANETSPSHEDQVSGSHQDDHNKNLTSSYASERDDQSNQNSTHSNNTTATNHDNLSHNKAGDKRQNYAMLGHKLQSAKDATFEDWYLPNMTFTLAADGKALVVSNHSRIDAQNASLNITMSVWKSWKSLVWLHVKTGTITLGNYSAEIHGGQAFYLHNHSRLILTGYILDNAPSDNQNASFNKPYEHPNSVLRMHAFSSSGQDMPTQTLTRSLYMTLMGMENSQSSKWFLAMKGELSLSS